MMLTHLGHQGLETLIEHSVRDCITAMECTRDVGGSLGTAAAAAALRARVNARLG